MGEGKGAAKYPSFAKSHTRDFKLASSNPCPIQLNDGLKLYTNCFPGCRSLISPANFAAFATLGSAVSSHNKSANGAYAMARFVAAAIPAR